MDNGCPGIGTEGTEDAGISLNTYSNSRGSRGPPGSLVALRKLRA